MATTTTRLSLRKPATSDLVNVTTDISNNMDTIDAAVGFERLGAFPGAPYTGKPVMRSDLSDRLFAYNGSLWTKVQGPLIYSTFAARDAAIPVPVLGDLAFITTTPSAMSYYNGSGWQYLVQPDNWSAYTPTWTASVSNPVIGNATQDCKFKQEGKTVHFRMHLTMGSTTTFGSGSWGFTLPVTPASDQTAPAFYSDSSAGTRWAGSCWITQASGIFRTFGPIDTGNTGVSSTYPYTWAQSDEIVISGVYEAL